MPDVAGGPPLARLLVLALVSMTVAGCGLRPAGSEAAPVPVAAPVEEAEEEEPLRPEALVEQGQALMIAGRHEEAIAPLETYLVFGDDPRHRLDAAWALALVFLVADPPIRSTERAAPLLERIREEHPGTVHALQAGWIQTLLRDLSLSRATVQEHERTIRELNALVEEMKRIDLSRRTGGGGGGGGTEPLPR
jgi:hypothetical protein